MRRWCPFACAAIALACSSGRHSNVCAPHYYYVVGDWAGPVFAGGVVVGVGGWYDPSDDGTSDPVADGSDTEDGTDTGGDSTGDDNSGGDPGADDPGASDPGTGDGVMAVTANACIQCTVVCVAQGLVNGATGSGSSHDAACAAAVGALEHWARPARLSACREVPNGRARTPAAPTVTATAAPPSAPAPATFGTKVSRAL